MRILLTGMGGFIGSHCLEYWYKNTEWELVGLDSFRHKGYVSRIPEYVLSKTRIFTHDLTVPIDPPLENLLLNRWIDDRGVVNERPIDVIVNMASDSAVERSTTDPTHCLRNNYELMINMLEFARRVKPKLFIQISTDEVYGEAEPAPFPGHIEWDKIVPSNPYAASKAAQEALAIAYWRTYGVPIIITNCMNIIGERQDPEKFLPKIIQCVAKGTEIPIYGDLVDYERQGDSVDCEWQIGSRVYLDVLNKADALKFLIQTYLRPGALPLYSAGEKLPARFNICGDTELNNLELAKMVAKLVGKELQYRLVQSNSIRPGYDRRYALDGSKLKQLGWKQPYSLEESLTRIVSWTMKNHHWLV